MIEIQPNAISFVTVNKVNAPNNNVKALWDTYYQKQIEDDHVADIEAIKLETERIRRMF